MPVYKLNLSKQTKLPNLRQKNTANSLEIQKKSDVIVLTNFLSAVFSFYPDAGKVNLR